MLTPKQIQDYPNKIVNLIEDLTAFIIGDISRRIAKTGNEALTPTAETQINVLQEIGAGIETIQEEIAKTNNLLVSEVERIFTEANIKSFNHEKKVFKLAEKELIFSTEKAQILENSIKNIQTNILSFTGSLGLMGKPLQEAYNYALNTAYLDIAYGSSDYVSAIKRQVKELANSGLQYITYDTGHIDKLDVAVRRAIITGLKQTTNRISEINAVEMGCNGWEVSAHMGARPTHAEWQGRQYAIAPNELGYPLFDDVVGNQMEEPNCRHSKFGIFLGITKPMMTIDEIEALDHEFIFSLNNKNYTSWKATQKQRSIERAIRETKRQIIGYQGALSATNLTDEHKKLLQKELTTQNIKKRNQMNIYKQFSDEANLLLQYERSGVVK